MILFLPVIHAGDFEGRFVGLGAAGGEEEFVQALGKNFKQLGAEARARCGGVAGRDIAKLARLLGNGFDDAGIFVAQVDAHQLRAEVEIALAGAVSEPAALGIGDVQRFPALLEAPGAVVGLARDGGNLLGGERRGWSFNHGCGPLLGMHQIVTFGLSSGRREGGRPR